MTCLIIRIYKKNSSTMELCCELIRLEKSKKYHLIDKLIRPLLIIFYNNHRTSISTIKVVKTK
jgi:hypothetical protein